MGIGRREFLKLFGASLTTLAAKPSPVAAVCGDLYIHRRLGLAFEKPKGWCFADIRDVGKLARGQLWDIDGLDVQSMYDDENLPLAVLAQQEVSEHGTEFTPSINFHLQNDEVLAELLQAMRHVDVYISPVDNAANELEGLLQVLPEAEMLSEATQRRVSECPAAHYAIACQFRHENLPRPVRVRMQVLSIIQLPACYRICLCDSPYLGPSKTVDFSPFLDSIKLV